MDNVPLDEVVDYTSKPKATPDGLNKYFDNCTHASGLRRAFCSCRKPEHGRCSKYAFIHRHGGDLVAAAAWLAAWEALSVHCESKEEHYIIAPSDADVLAVYSSIIDSA